MDCQFPNISTCEEKWAYDVGIRREGQAMVCPVDPKDRCIVHRIKQRVREGGCKDPLNQVVGSLATTPMTERDLLITQIEFMAARLPRALDLLQYVVDASFVPTRIALSAPLTAFRFPCRHSLPFLDVFCRCVPGFLPPLSSLFTICGPTMLLPPRCPSC